MGTEKNKSRPALLALRAVIAFLLLGALIAVLYWVGYDAYPDVAEWSEPGYRDVLIMDGETYRLDGRANTTKYPLGELLGEVKDDGVPEVTETETEAPTEEEPEDVTDDLLMDTVPEVTEEETPTYEELPAEVVSFMKGDHAYLVYSVDKQEDKLLVYYPDGKYYLYVLEPEQTTDTDQASN